MITQTWLKQHFKYYSGYFIRIKKYGKLAVYMRYEKQFQKMLATIHREQDSAQNHIYSFNTNALRYAGYNFTAWIYWLFSWITHFRDAAKLKQLQKALDKHTANHDFVQELISIVQTHRASLSMPSNIETFMPDACSILSIKISEFSASLTALVAMAL